MIDIQYYKDIICVTITAQRRGEEMELYRNKGLFTIEIKLPLKYKIDCEKLRC